MNYCPNCETVEGKTFSGDDEVLTCAEDGCDGETEIIVVREHDWNHER